jgi:hypothetical protein
MSTNRSSRTIAAMIVVMTTIGATECVAQSGKADPYPDISAIKNRTPIRPQGMGGPGSLNALPFHGSPTGVDRGQQEFGGIIYAIKVYSGNFVNSVGFCYYFPTGDDNLYHGPDKTPWTCSPQIGAGGGEEHEVQSCPREFAAIGLQGASGTAAVDRIGLVCGQIGNHGNQATTYPIWGGNGGNTFIDVCGLSQGLQGFLTGVHVRSGDWMDGIQGLCQQGD